MRLIIKYSVGDGCTYHCEETVPIICYSKELAIRNFEDSARAAYETGCRFRLFGVEFDSHDFFYKDEKGRAAYWPPTFYTVDQYFAEAINVDF